MHERIKRNILQYQNPNSPESGDTDISSLLPSADTILNVLSKGELPRARKSPTYTHHDGEEIEQIVETSLHEVLRIEQAARNSEKWNIPEEIIQGPNIIVDFSAPGTYYQPRKNDRYKDFTWSWNMDRQRADTSAALGIHIAGLATCQDFSEFTKAPVLDGLNSGLNHQRDAVRNALQQSNTRFIYLGTPEEAQAIRKVLRTPSSFIPPHLVDVLDDRTENTVDQVLALKSFLNAHIRTKDNPYGFIEPTTNIILPLGFQAIRALPMVHRHAAIPKDMNIFVFPIATPASGITEYATMETKGRVFYTLTGNASQKMPEYTLLGDIK